MRRKNARKWVDGNDEKWLEEKNKYSHDEILRDLRLQEWQYGKVKNNLRIYNSIKKNGSVKLYKQEVKVWKKTLNYVHDDIDIVTIKYRSNTMEMDSSKFKNGMNLKLNTYKKYIDEALFDNVKTLYI